MRLEVVTPKHMISLGISVKDDFLKCVLPFNEDEQTYDVVQTMYEDTISKIESMDVYGAFTERIKQGLIEAFKTMNIGDKFLCINAWVIDYESDEAKFYWELQRLCNEGLAFEEATVLANKWLDEYRSRKKDAS